MRYLVLLVFSGMFSAACGPLGIGSEGELSEGEFYVAGCDPLASSRECPIPGRVAQGSHLTVAYSGNRPVDGDGKLFVSGASSEWASGSGRITFPKTGVVALLAKNRKGTVADFLNIEVSPVNRLSLSAERTPPVIELNDVPSTFPCNAVVRVVADAWSSLSEPLGGVLGFGWSVSDENLATLEAVNPDGSALIHTRSPGSVTVRATLGSLSADLSFDVREPQ